MKTKFILSAMLCCAVPALAAPPAGIDLSYDSSKKTLHVSARHPSDRLDRYYIRKIVIYKNDTADDEVTFSRQKLASGIEEDIAYEAKPRDVIKVEIFASEGGKGSAEYEVPQ